MKIQNQGMLREIELKIEGTKDAEVIVCRHDRVEDCSCKQKAREIMATGQSIVFIHVFYQ
jgi:hypothetical protein